MTIEETGTITLVQGVRFELELSPNADLTDCEFIGFISKGWKNPTRYGFLFERTETGILVWMDDGAVRAIPYGEYIYEIKFVKDDEFYPYRKSGTAIVQPGSGDIEPIVVVDPDGSGGGVSSTLLTQIQTAIANLVQQTSNLTSQVTNLTNSIRPDRIIALTSGTRTQTQTTSGWKSEFVIDTGFGDHDFAIVQTRDRRDGFVIDNPVMQITGIDSAILSFYGSEPVPDNAIEVWLMEGTPVGSAEPILHRGINVRMATGQQDLELIARLGFDHVRMAFDPSWVMDFESEGLDPNGASELENAILRATNANLSVLVDPHSLFPPPNNIAQQLEDPAFVPKFVKCWELLARRLSVFDPRKIYLETLNEPVFYADPSVWWIVQAQIVEAIRRGAPTHPIVVTAAKWSEIDRLIELPILSDPNIIYNFHFYEPMVLSHQSVYWLDPTFAEIQGLDYPASPQNTIDTANRATTQQAKDWINYYGNVEQWEFEKVRSRIQLVSDWATQHNLKVMCNEFGIFHKAPQSARNNYLRDVRIALEAASFSWALWHWDDGSFGLYDPNSDTLNAEYIAALGLNPVYAAI